jgi:hypothetical protein
MCPEYWCPISEVPMSEKKSKIRMEYAIGEKPLDLSSASFLSNGATRSPGLLALRKTSSGSIRSLLLQKHEKYKMS